MHFDLSIVREDLSQLRNVTRHRNLLINCQHVRGFFEGNNNLKDNLENRTLVGNCFTKLLRSEYFPHFVHFRIMVEFCIFKFLWSEWKSTVYRLIVNRFWRDFSAQTNAWSRSEFNEKTSVLENQKRLETHSKVFGKTDWSIVSILLFYHKFFLTLVEVSCLDFSKCESKW